MCILFHLLQLNINLSDSNLVSCRSSVGSDSSRIMKRADLLCSIDWLGDPWINSKVWTFWLLLASQCKFFHLPGQTGMTSFRVIPDVPAFLVSHHVTCSSFCLLSGCLECTFQIVFDWFSLVQHTGQKTVLLVASCCEIFVLALGIWIHLCQ